MGKRLSELVAGYRAQVEVGDVPQAYERLVKYVMMVRRQFELASQGRYSVGNVSPGYMDFTYFPFFDQFLRGEKLRFGVVLDHRRTRFELWLMGQNADTQLHWWEVLKTSPWNQGVTMMPKYSVLETVLVASPDFDDLDGLTDQIITSALTVAGQVTDYIETLSPLD